MQFLAMECNLTYTTPSVSYTLDKHYACASEYGIRHLALSPAATCAGDCCGNARGYDYDRSLRFRSDDANAYDTYKEMSQMILSQR